MDNPIESLACEYDGKTLLYAESPTGKITIDATIRFYEFLLGNFPRDNSIESKFKYICNNSERPVKFLIKDENGILTSKIFYPTNPIDRNNNFFYFYKEFGNDNIYELEEFIIGQELEHPSEFFDSDEENFYINNEP